MASKRTLRASDEILSIVHAFDVNDGRRDSIRELSRKVSALESALGEIAECADWCEECEPTERKLATHVVQPYGMPEFLCDECAAVERDQYRKAMSKGCGPQPEVEPHEQDEVTAIALRALGLLPAAHRSDSPKDTP